MASSTQGRYRSDDARWAAVTARDQRADGAFYYSVRTTCVYCRPGCPARLPRRENVRFHPSADAAEAAGFRPCQRCRPREASPWERHRKAVVAACRSLETAPEMPSLDDLARGAKLSRFHFHRVFKAITGVTPKAYGAAHRARRVREEFTRGKPVTAALYAAGFGSSGRFYERASGLLGMTPTAYRAGAPLTVVRYGFGQSSLGTVLVATTERGVAAILLGDDEHTLLDDLKARFPRASLELGGRSFARLLSRVIRHVEHPDRSFALPLDIQGTAFEHRVWQALRAIPPGSTSTYADIALALGTKRGARAVGRACARNPVAVAVPCHRVLRQGGDLSGYRWGIERKQELLRREALQRAAGAAGSSSRASMGNMASTSDTSSCSSVSGPNTSSKARATGKRKSNGARSR